MGASAPSIRRSVLRIIDALDARDGDIVAAENEVGQHMQDILARDDLLEIAARREAVLFDNSAWLYWDTEFSVVMSEIPEDRVITPHNHGIWEYIGIYRGEMDYTRYRRTDDLSRPGRATLEITEQGVLEPGDLTLAHSPPHDIHGMTALTTTYAIAVYAGKLAPVRQFYDPEAGTYIEKPTRQKPIDWVINR